MAISWKAVTYLHDQRGRDDVGRGVRVREYVATRHSSRQHATTSRHYITTRHESSLLRGREMIEMCRDKP